MGFPMLYEKRRVIPTLLLALALPAAYAQSAGFPSMSAGNWTGFVAPGSIAAGFGVNIATQMTVATSLPLSTTLGSTTVTITDSKGVSTPAPIYMVSDGQVNYMVPATVALGAATVTAVGNGTNFTGPLEVYPTYPRQFLRPTWVETV